jgi:hypothetical protein
MDKNGNLISRGGSVANGDRINLNDFEVYFEVFKIPKPMLRDDNVYAEEKKVEIKD